MTNTLTLEQTTVLIASLEIMTRKYDVRKAALLGEIGKPKAHEHLDSGM
jgi:hypothetical protein